jgi:polysaccharide export outer membrane protein
MTFVHRFLLCAVATSSVSLSVLAQAPSSGPRAPGKVATGVEAVSADAGILDYVIGPEDVLGVVFWRDAEMSGDVTVRPDGKITLPLIGELRAAGLTPDTLKQQIQTSAVKYLSDANVAVVVRQINSRKVYITGQVTTPGAYPLTGPRTVMQLISLAGGVTEFADSSSITIMRTIDGRTTSHKFNYKDVSRGKNLEQNLMLRPGDTVVVP